MSTTYKVLIIDDEPIAIDIVSQHVSNFPNLQILGKFTNALQALPLLHSQNIHLVFLDIEMPGISGIDFLKSMKNPPAVILTTAYRDYAVEAYDLEVIDYLLKPISFDRFLRAVNRFLTAASPNHTEAKTETAHELSGSDIIELKADKKVYKIRKSDICYIESLDDYIKVHTAEQRILVYMRMHQIEKQLDNTNFVRVHRSYLVNKNCVTAYSAANVELGSLQLPFGRTYRDAAIQALKI